MSHSSTVVQFRQNNIKLTYTVRFDFTYGEKRVVAIALCYSFRHYIFISIYVINFSSSGDGGDGRVHLPKMSCFLLPLSFSHSFYLI